MNIILISNCRKDFRSLMRIQSSRDIFESVKEQNKDNFKNKWASQNESQKPVMIYVKESVGKIASKIWRVGFVFILSIFGIVWPWSVTLTFGQGHQHLGHWMRLNGLYLRTKYEVCRWNSMQDMVSCLAFYPL